MAFVRFVVSHNDPDSGRPQGLFQAVSDLEHASALLDHEQKQYDEVYEWFRKNLKKPRSLARSSKPNAKNVALSWFKDTAVEHFRKIRELASILEAHDIPVRMVRTDRPGFVVYEDEFQVAAEPFAETFAERT